LRAVAQPDYNVPPDGFLAPLQLSPSAYPAAAWKSFQISGKVLEKFFLGA